VTERLTWKKEKETILHFSRLEEMRSVGQSSTVQRPRLCRPTKNLIPSNRRSAIINQNHRLSFKFNFIRFGKVFSEFCCCRRRKKKENKTKTCLSSRLDSLIVSNFPIHPSSFARMSFFFFFFHYAHISREPIRNFSENSRE
jgi:hypothetical protein